MMRDTIILRVVVKLLLPVILIFALYVQFHGDYGPGGGFQAGVAAAAAVILYGLVFGEAGNSWSSFDKFKPFQVKRSLGAGIRIFMPMFGLLGFDFGYGFDDIPGTPNQSGWQTHFMIGQQF